MRNDNIENNEITEITENLEKIERRDESDLMVLIKDQRGATAAEYAMLLMAVCAGVAVAMKGLGTTISNATNTAGSAITSPGGQAAK